MAREMPPVLYDEKDVESYFSRERFAEVLKEVYGLVLTRQQFEGGTDDHKEDYAIGLLLHIERIRKLVPANMRGKGGSIPADLRLSEEELSNLEKKCRLGIAA